MNLHDVPDKPVIVLTAEEEDDKPTCPCGGQRFLRMERHQTFERHYVSFAGRYPNEDWDTRDSEFIDAEDWECDSCDTPVDPDLADQIRESI